MTRIIMPILILWVGLFSLALLNIVRSGWTEEDSAADPPSGSITQLMCPVLPDEPIDPEISTIHQGQEIYLCCMSCRRKFRKNPDLYLASLSRLPLTAQANGPTEDEQTHDHATSHESENPGLQRLISFLGRFHPMVVHFPIALILAGALAELIAIKMGRPSFAPVARYCLRLGTLGVIVTAPLGWSAAAGANYPDLERILFFHRWTGTTTAILAVVMVGLGEIGRQRSDARFLGCYRGLLFLCVCLIAITGHLGAVLIYGLDYYKY